MNAQPQSCDFQLDTEDNERLANLCGQFDENLRQVERSFGVEINNRGNLFQIIGEPNAVQQAAEALRKLYIETVKGPLTPSAVHLTLHLTQQRQSGALVNTDAASLGTIIRTRRASIHVRGVNQSDYVKSIRNHDISFGVGPAGTGKTYLAVACAVEALEREKVQRILLVRPAVEAGERLGFLPGDLSQKIDPYLRPLYDALFEMLGMERVAKLIEKNIIEVAPLAYMRGRTLNDSFVILDEAQNATVEQMKMFLTRIGFGTVAVITGDVTQIDLPRGRRSGLRHAIQVLKNVSEISFTFFNAKDVVRHPLVQRIVTAYEEFTETEPGSEAADKER